MKHYIRIELEVEEPISYYGILKRLALVPEVIAISPIVALDKPVGTFIKKRDLLAMIPDLSKSTHR